jgi:8-amino-7-oxononanoate synthase
VLGDQGRGTPSAFGLHGDIDVTIGTFGKSFGVSGAFVYGSATLCQFLLNRARSFVFSTAVPPAQTAACRAGIRIASEEPWRRDLVLGNARLLRAHLATLGVNPLGEPDAHILPIPVGEAERTVAIGRELAVNGFLVGAVRPPTVPDGGSRLRITVSAAHTREQLSDLASALTHVLAQ